MRSSHSVPTADTVRTALGSILRGLREATGRTLSEVAAEAGISPAYLSEVERGRKDVSTEVLLGVVYALGAEIAAVHDEMAHRLRGGAESEPWPRDPRQQLRIATSALDPEALRTVAQFSAFLATTGAQPPRRRIGFIVRDQQ
jgi:transcriptional regulator with XRE-family HTH domain